MKQKKWSMKIVVMFTIFTLLLPVLVNVVQVYAVSTEAGDVRDKTGSSMEEGTLGSSDLETDQTFSSDSVNLETIGQEFNMSWLLVDLTTTKDQMSEFDQEYWKGTLQVAGNRLDKETELLTFVIDMGSEFNGTLSSQNETTVSRKAEKPGQWVITRKFNDEEDFFEELFDVIIEKEKVKFDEQKKLSYENIKVVSTNLTAPTEELSLILTDTSKEMALSKNENDAEIIENKEEEEPTDSQTVTDNKMIANLSVSEVFSKNNPYSGEYFDMTVRVNSGSIGDDEGEIEGLQTVVMLEDTVEIVSLPKNNFYQVKQEKVGSQNKITITYLKNLPVGNMLSIPFGLKFKKGISMPTTSLEGSIVVTAKNANSKDKFLGELHPKNANRLPNYLTAGIDPDAEATEAHTTKIKIDSEKEIGGLNIKNGKLVLAFPEEIDLYSVVYEGVNYPVSGPTDGTYSVEIPLGDIDVETGIKTVDLTYEYPFSGTGSAKEYVIKATLTGNRLNGEVINEELMIPETVPPAGNDLSGYGGIKFFDKVAPSKVIRSEGQSLSYTINFTPKLDMKEVSLVDDPVRNTAEPDFFSGFSYESISWSAQKSKNPAITSLVRTEVFYQTNKNAEWRSAGGPQVSGIIHIGNLGLTEGESVTTVKYEFSYEGKMFIPKDAGKVSINGTGKTLEGIKDANLSLADGITNTLHIYGYRKFPNQPDSFYEAFVEGNYEANQDDKNNTKTATTTYKGAGALPGYIGWEAPFSPALNNIEESFTYQIGVNNSYGSGVLKEPILYVTVPTTIQIESVELMNPQNNPNAKIDVRTVDDENQLVTITYNNDWNPMEYWNYNHGIRIKAQGSKNVRAQEIFNNYLVSGDDNQVYDGGTSIENIPGVGVKRAGVSKWRVVKFNRSVGLGSKKEISTDKVNYSRWTNIKNEESGTDVTFRLTIPNNGEIDIDSLHIIDQLPHDSDSMAISTNGKNSSIGGQLKTITLADGSPLDSEIYELYYSTDAASENNKKELDELSNDYSNWTNWDGQTALPIDAVAIKIIKKDGLAKQQEVSFIMDYHIPKIDEEINTIWNSFAVGGAYVDGSSQVNLEVGEPIKSGAYVGQQEPTKKIAGVVWKDENQNGVREKDEPLLKDYEISLYDWNNDLVSTTKTKADGSYEFTDLYNAKYRVTVKRNTTEYTLTDYQKGTNKEIDNNFLEVESNSNLGEAWVDLTTETHPLNIDVGYMEKTSIDGYVWHDTNYDGLQTLGETPVSNLKVSLFRVDSDANGEQLVYVTSTTTGNNGKYYFTGSDIKPGKYVTQVDIPENYAVTAKGNLTDRNNSKFNSDGKTDIFTAKSGVNSFWDLGLVNKIPSYVTVSGEKVWEDNQDKRKERPSEINVQLYQNDNAYRESLTISDPKSDTWTFEFNDLPEYDSNGKKYAYTIKEVSVPENYESTVDNEKYVITNTYKDSTSSSTTETTSESSSSSTTETTSESSSSSTTETTSESSSSSTTESTSESSTSETSSDTSDTTSQLKKGETNNSNGFGTDNKKTKTDQLPKTGEEKNNHSMLGMFVLLVIFMILFRHSFSDLIAGVIRNRE